jgi:hypothetical protein
MDRAAAMNTNVCFGDWSAEKMQDPELRAAYESLESTCQKPPNEIPQDILALEENLAASWRRGLQVDVRDVEAEPSSSEYWRGFPMLSRWNMIDAELAEKVFQ